MYIYFLSCFFQICSFVCRTKKKIFWSGFCLYNESHWGPKHNWTPLTFIWWTKKERKKVIQVWNDLRVSKFRQHLHFWVNYAFKGAISDAGWKSLHTPIASIKLSGLNVFICIYIFCGRWRTKKCLSNQNPRSYLPVNICICIPLRSLFAQDTSSARSRTQARQSENARKASILVFLYFY